jgi:hypothetical protein
MDRSLGFPGLSSLAPIAWLYAGSGGKRLRKRFCLFPAWFADVQEGNASEAAYKGLVAPHAMMGSLLQPVQREPAENVPDAFFSGKCIKIGLRERLFSFMLMIVKRFHTYVILVLSPQTGSFLRDCFLIISF